MNELYITGDYSGFARWSRQLVLKEDELQKAYHDFFDKCVAEGSIDELPPMTCEIAELLFEGCLNEDDEPYLTDLPYTVTFRDGSTRNYKTSIKDWLDGYIHDELYSVEPEFYDHDTDWEDVSAETKSN